MGWIQKLYETYEQCKGREPPGSDSLLPISHTYQQAHIEITLDAKGDFRGARIVDKEETIIPATEKSAGRTGKIPPPHPLCDKVQYCASDYTEFGGAKPSFFGAYEELLSAWCESSYSHPKAKAVLSYVHKGDLVADLVREKILHVGADGKLITRWTRESQAPEIFRLLTGKGGERDQGDAFIRWHVHEENSNCTAVWEDASLQDAWARYDAGTRGFRGLCMVSGQPEEPLATSHPKRIRHARDGAKLISANDESGFTFRGRFTDKTGQQACGVGYEVTQKAHNALRWLIHRQAYRNQDQVIVAWAVRGKPIPDPFKDSRSLILGGEDAEEPTAKPVQPALGDAGQAFSRRLSKAIAGYQSRLDDNEDIVVMSLDSATPGHGRMAITFYRELRGSEFLSRIQVWHEIHAWPQDFGKESKFVGAPSPRDIAEAAYGRRVDDKLRKATVERLLPCIVDGQPIPRDLEDSVVRRACNRAGSEYWEWEKGLGIACALFKGFFKRREYQMTLETERTSRDYLYGRLLAIAEHVENRALYLGGEMRDTTASKLMQRFADRPASTWRTIELALAPSRSRLKAKRPGFLHEMDKLLDSVICGFESSDFLDDHKLSGEFLLGYHCQRRFLNLPKADSSADDEQTISD